ncbi:MAG: amidoligase family protein [Bdellovibrio sp.]|nr:amidoligase family protein [Bdellovibrio sp.]
MKTILTTLLLILGSTHLAQASLGERKVGIEFEFAGVGIGADNTNLENHRWLLDQVKARFGGGEISVKPWNKYSNAQGTSYATMKDAQGREWSVLPEIMTNGKFDGYELVTPPLNSTDDGAKIEKVVAAIEQSNRFVKGWSSSTHYTYDISDLVEKKNVSKVVDLILFLESRILEIYNTVNPERYHHVINTYAIPLALNQKELLADLAAMPPKERTMDNVRAVFLKYEGREEKLVGGHAVSVWKYRAINYGKFFGIGRFSQLPVLEFRLGDLVGPGNVVKMGEFYQRLIEVGSKTPTQSYVDPIPDFQTFDRTQAEQHATLDRYMSAVPLAQYQTFLREINMKYSVLPLKSYGFRKSTCSIVFM